jgi:hypothetical protein
MTAFAAHSLRLSHGPRVGSRRPAVARMAKHTLPAV